MKHFTITSNTEAAALRPFASEPLKVGHIVTPSAGNVTHTAWDNYPEDDALTFEECMAVVRDEVTHSVMEELGAINCEVVLHDGLRIGWNGKDVRIEIDTLRGDLWVNIPNNPTATKIKLLAAILRGEDI